MTPGDPIFIPFPVTCLPHDLAPLHGTETGTFLAARPNGLGEMFYKVEINGQIYPLREGEFEGPKVDPAQEYDNM